MRTALQRHGNPQNVPQTQGFSGQVPNSAGGFSFQLDDWGRLQRFLILGTDGGTYYIGEQQLTRDNIDVLESCAHEDPYKVLNMIFMVTEERRAPKPEPAIFALAYMTAHPDVGVRRIALAMLPRVCRIGTHLFQFAEFVEMFRGWGSALRKGVANWYLEKSPRDLAYQVTKYQQRNGWSHRDLLRLSHPKVDVLDAGENAEKNYIFGYVTGNHSSVPLHNDYSSDGIEYIGAVTAAKTADKDLTIELIKRYGLTREMIRSEFLNDKDVQSALLQRMPMTALIRNLGNLTRLGLFDNWSDDLKRVQEQLTSTEAVQRSGIHPVAVLNALRTYASGSGFRGRNVWIPNQDILESLNQTFRLSFGNIQPSNKRTLIGLDVSGSMTFSAPSGFDNLTCAEAAGAMLMATVETEPFVRVMAFSHEFKELPVKRGDSLERVSQLVYDRNFGRTDCSLPMLYAIEHGLDIDTFIVYTDNETFAGTIHPHKALERYRRERNNPDARLIVVSMTANPFSIANPDDDKMLDVVGFDASLPNVIAQFSRGEL